MVPAVNLREQKLKNMEDHDDHTSLIGDNEQRMDKGG